MCLAIPGRLIERWLGVGDMPFGRVAFGSVRREVCLAYTPEAQIGAYLIVHVGFAIQVLDEQAAHSALALWDSISPPDAERARTQAAGRVRAVPAGVKRSEET